MARNFWRTNGKAFGMRRGGVAGVRCAVYVVVVLAAVCYFVYFLRAVPVVDVDTLAFFDGNRVRYLINNSKCKIPDINPFNVEVRGLYEKKDYVSCTELPLLTYITKNYENTEAILHINTSLVPLYSKDGVSCCLIQIIRPSEGDVDNYVNESSCEPFHTSTRLPVAAIKVKCTSSAPPNKEIYTNVHHAILVAPGLKTRHNKGRAKSVLVIGVDSVSRLNMMRVLPLTRHHLHHSHNWHEFRIFNKMGDNTFPNVMSMLTGLNETSARTHCDPTVEGGLGRCSFIWDEFKKAGYVTAYAEDDAAIGTFNYHKKGFKSAPVDYYMRPYSISAEGLQQRYVDEVVYCTGPETYGERIMRNMEDFVTTFRGVASFGFFWMNSFSHSHQNAATRMDERLERFLVRLERLKAFENSVVVFLSDHGMRFGKILYTTTGWYEERLPMLYMRVPEGLNATNLIGNVDKLVSPYDLYMTLQHILVMSMEGAVVKQSDGCAHCKSLFEQFEDERSCEEASIPSHWCACCFYRVVSSSDEIVRAATDYSVGFVRTKISKFSEGDLCEQFELNRVISARITETYNENRYLLLVFETTPSAVFQTTVKISSGKYTLQDGVSRLDVYDVHSRCVDDYRLKLLCYCK